MKNNDHLITIRNALTGYVEDCCDDAEEMAAIDDAFRWIKAQSYAPPAAPDQFPAFTANHFKTPTEAILYAFEECLESLADDLNSMWAEAGLHYDDDDIRAMEAKIADIESAMTRVDIIERTEIASTL